MILPRIFRVDIEKDYNQQGQLIGASWPFAMQRLEIVNDSLNLIETIQVSTRIAAVETAEHWARKKRGNMALAYSRRSGMVLAQYCQASDGALGFLLYTSHGRLEGQYNAHLFEPQPGTVPEEPGVKQEQKGLPCAGAAPTCTYPVTDDAYPGQEWWYAQRPSGSGLWASVYPDRPAVDEAGGEEPLVTVVLEVYGGQLRILWWDRQNLEGDPHVLVVESHLAAIPLTRLAVLQQQTAEKA